MEALLETAELEAWADLCEAMPAPLRATTGLETRRIGNALAIRAPRLPALLFNRAIGVGAAELRAVLEFYRKGGVHAFYVQVAPGAVPPEMLAAHALAARGRWAKVQRGTAPPPHIATDLRIEQIAADRADLFGSTAATGFGVPAELAPWLGAAVGRAGWRHYLALDGDIAVACAALFVRAEVAWLGVAATVLAHRRRGGQGALLVRRIGDAIDAGCRHLVTETGEDLPSNPNPSYHNMLRTGFSLAYLRTNYGP